MRLPCPRHFPFSQGFRFPGFRGHCPGPWPRWPGRSIAFSPPPRCRRLTQLPRAASSRNGRWQIKLPLPRRRGVSSPWWTVTGQRTSCPPAWPGSASSSPCTRRYGPDSMQSISWSGLVWRASVRAAGPALQPRSGALTLCPGAGSVLGQWAAAVTLSSSIYPFTIVLAALSAARVGPARQHLLRSLRRR